jgi:hypothetical protein
MADATSLAVIQDGFIVTIITPFNCGIRTEKIAEATTHAHLLVPQGN